MDIYCFGVIVPELTEGHFIHGEGACFIWANVVGATHGLAGLHLAYQILIFKHFFNWKGQGEGDGQGQSFGYGNNDNSDGY